MTNKALYFHPRKITGGLGMSDTTSFSTSQSTTSASSAEDTDGSLSPQVLQDRRWQLDRLVELYRRRYVLENCAIELFFADVPEVYFAFDSTSDLQKFFRILRRQNTPLLLPYTSKTLFTK
jgi:hypothetical protein